ncbi:hypothetical protein ASD24_13150 [Paenibacillus sp. Root52]|uniref:GNAT family N-acetyltransferase n=1 Tax=Paenibacillus sp. Root52 TaxID=1736552 RepID=UPI0006F66FD6|nr:GNAT family N-acetyltransferase [Paenibacillus sp. Root52]KQY83222.1 hypothetical protein ASD24_13150 [Paenibacillus sp. Root52]
MQIRQAREGDAKAIAYVHTESWKTTYRGIIPDEFLDHLTTEARVPQWEQMIRSSEKEQILLVAEQADGKIVGFACGGREREGKLPYDGEIYAIYLLQAAQGQRIGTMLANQVVQYLHTLKLRSLLIWALEKNPACRFYEQMGGTLVHSQTLSVSGENQLEVAYGWQDLQLFGKRSQSQE